ncbi:MAG: hypothetical protein WDN45_16090 [Caulobacteraceae bacterium]
MTNMYADNDPRSRLGYGGGTSSAPGPLRRLRIRTVLRERAAGDRRRRAHLVRPWPELHRSGQRNRARRGAGTDRPGR